MIWYTYASINNLRTDWQFAAKDIDHFRKYTIGYLPIVYPRSYSCSMTSVPRRRLVSLPTAPTNPQAGKWNPRIKRSICMVSYSPDPPINSTSFFLLGSGCRFNSDRSSLDMPVLTSLPVSNKTFQRFWPDSSVKTWWTKITSPNAFCISTGSSSLDIT